MNNNVLWLSSITFPEAESLLCGKKLDFKSSGGWLVSLAEALVNQTDIELIIVSLNGTVNDCTVLRGNRIVYYVLPSKRSHSYYEKELKQIRDMYNPTAIHIHGTEHQLGFHYLNACGNDNVIVSLQGVITEIAKHYHDGLSCWDVIKNITFRDLLKGSILREKKRFIEKGITERAILKKVTKVTGRTTFDKAFAVSINEKISYTYCSEALRQPFYTGK